MIRCTRCCMPNSRPDTPFIKGVCSACLSFDRQQNEDWDTRKCELLDLFNRQRVNGSGFDCVVASSGGKDSHAQVLSLLKLGVKPLIVTATTCMLTDLGRMNIDNLKQYASTIEVTPNQDVRARLNYLGLTMVGDISWPEHVAIFTTPMRVAAEHGIPLVFYGENPQAAYGGPAGADEAVQMTQRWVTEFGGFLGLRPRDMVGLQAITKANMQEYCFPDVKVLSKVGVEAHFLGQYLGPWNSRQNAQTAIDMGMQFKLPTTANWWDWENLDNAMTGLHDYMMEKKYGYGRACAQLSVDVRWNHITRERALDIVEEKSDRFPYWYAGIPVQNILYRLGISFEDLKKIIKQFTCEDRA